MTIQPAPLLDPGMTHSAQVAELGVGDMRDAIAIDRFLASPEVQEELDEEED
ncbi:MAG: hypothetical protein IPN71_04900 [Fibrobacteres bacterium]|nr:hypothetical protein [Fibrobacterota bacterium]